MTEKLMTEASTDAMKELVKSPAFQDFAHLAMNDIASALQSVLLLEVVREEKTEVCRNNAVNSLRDALQKFRDVL